MQFKSHNPHFGVVATGTAQTPLVEDFRNSRGEIIAQLKAHGYVYFSGAEATQIEFESLIDELCESDPETHLGLHGAKARDVFTGRPFLGVHAEQKYLPWSPDIIAFYCERPASEGGETTVCDGLEFLDALSESTREFFLSKRLMYRIRFGKRRWMQTFRASTRRELRKTMAHPDISYRIGLLTGRLTMQYRTSAIQNTRHQGKPAFVNSLVHALDYPGYGLCLEDGSAIPDAIVAETRDVARQISVAIPWKAGDFVIIDNSRVMHGREAYDDPQRAVRAKHGMARFT